MNAPILSIVWLSLQIALASTALGLPFAFGAAYLLSRGRFRGKLLLDGIVNLPLVMPPVTTGYLLLLFLGRRGLLGAPLYEVFGISVAFSSGAAILAAAVVAFPLVTRSIRVSLDMVDPRFEEAAATLGASRFEVLRRVTLPLIVPGIIAGAVLGFARSLGEFGATITFAGNIEGETRTIPLAVYSLLEVPGEEGSAAILVVLSILLSFLSLAGSSLLSRRAAKRLGGRR